MLKNEEIDLGLIPVAAISELKASYLSGDYCIGTDGEAASVCLFSEVPLEQIDKVYLDYLQNRHGQLIVAPFSVRPLPGASVSMPLMWDEVEKSLDPRAFTIKTAIDRMERLGADPVLPVLEENPDLLQVLGRLAEAFA